MRLLHKENEIQVIICIYKSLGKEVQEMYCIKMKKNRILAVALAVLMVLSVLPSYVWGSSSEGEIDSDVKGIAIILKNAIDDSDIEMENVTITITDEDGTEATGSISEDNKKYEVELNMEKQWKCSIEAEGYESRENIEISLNEPENDTFVICIYPEKEYSDSEITGNITDNNGNPICNTKFTLTCSKCEESVIEIVTDEDGGYSINASDYIINYGGYNISSAEYKTSEFGEIVNYGEHNITLNEKEKAKFEFEEPNPANKKFEGGSATVEYKNTAIGGYEEGKIEYQIESVETTDVTEQEGIAAISDDGTLTINKPCTVTVKAVLEGNEEYKKAEAKYTLKVDKGVQDNFKFTDMGTITKKFGEEYKNEAAGGYVEGDVTYSSSDELIAEVNEKDGTVTIKNTGKVTITATKPGNDIYNEAKATYMLIINPREQTGFKFNETTETGKIVKTYGEKYINEATGGEGEGNVTYTSSDISVAEVNAETGEVRLLKAGETVITAKKAGDGKYNEATITYTLEVKRAEAPELKFEKPSPGTVTYGTAFSNIASCEPAKGSISYKSSDENIAVVDKQGNITMKKNGKVTITAEKAEDEQYMATSAAYDITIEYLKVENMSDVYEITGEHINDSGWYTGVINIKAKTGYTLSTNQSASDDRNVWTASLDNVLVQDGVHTYTFYAKSDKGITDAINVDLRRDTNNPKISFDKEASNDKGYYNKDVSVKINVNDTTLSSGIKEAEYWVTSDKQDGKGNIETQREKLYLYEDNAVNEYNDTIIVSAQDNNSDNVCLYVRAVDIAGHESIESVSLRIDTVTPSIEVSFDNNNYNKISDGVGYYTGKRTATIVITERTSGFEPEEATRGITITAKNSKGENIELSNVQLIGDWITEEGNSLDEATHMADVSFIADANYTFSIEYTDKAGNVNSNVSYGDSTTPNKFTIDNTKPVGTVTVSGKGTWSKLLDIITFGLWSDETLSVVGAASDETSPIEKIMYYKTSDNSVKSESELDKITDWKEFNTINIGANEKFVVYLKLQDYAGNVSYIGTNGVIADNKAPIVSLSSAATENGIYKDNTDITVSVEDVVEGNTYSGIKSITYEVYNRGNRTQSGTLYTFDKTNPAISDLKRDWSGNITVDKSLNNSNNVEIRVYAVDNANNTGSAVKNIKIDTTLPEITVTYDNNNGDVSFPENTYFKESRTATVQIRERNFDDSDVIITITNTEGTVPVISRWTTIEGTDNGDDTLHTATLLFSDDGDYTFDISYTDEAGNSNNSAVDYSGSLAPVRFTIDKTAPIISVSYDNNDAKNGNYYAADRTAMITVEEHNFETTRFEITITAIDNGQEKAVPAVGQWENIGDTHIAVINFTDDALYTMNISYKDMAGNDSNAVETQSFYIDKTAPSVSVKGIGNQSANNAEGNIGFVLECTDTNFDVFEPVLTTIADENGKYVTKAIEGVLSDISNGRIFTIQNLDSDGIYTLKCTVTDKAGNTFDIISITDDEGNIQENNKTEDNILLTFSVNRDGSAFSLEQSTLDLIEKYYVQAVSEDIRIIEVNVDPIMEYVVKNNGTVLSENVDYTVEITGGLGEWSKYVYTIKKSLFEDEGENNIVIESIDKADTTAYSDVKNLNVSFVVDKTAPTVTMSGIDDNARYQTTEQTVTAIPTDDGGKLNSFKVVVLDEAGVPLSSGTGEDISIRFDMTGDELINYLNDNDGKITFTIPEGMNNQVQVLCSDCAVNTEGQTNEWLRTYTGITVSQSGMVILYANKPLFYGIIAGVAVLIAAIVISTVIIVRKRKVKN